MKGEKGPMTPDLMKKLEACDSLPTPSGIATQIVRVANDPNADLGKVSAILGLDPAVTIKVLRLANSPLYGQRRQIQNLRQAIVVLGLDATISLALSFSLLKSWQDPKGRTSGLDYELFWRRSLLAAPIGRILGRKTGIGHEEELFLTCLIQDIGVLVLDQTVDGLYEGLGIRQASHRVLIERERERLDTDHAAVSAWLLKKWSFPDLITEGASGSHSPGRVSPMHEHGPFVRCVTLSSMIAETFLRQEGDEKFLELAEAADHHLKIGREELTDLLDEVGAAIADVERIFETQILAQADTDNVLQQARDTLTMRTLQSLQTVASLQEEAESLEIRTRQLEESGKRDGLTKLYNRAYLDSFLDTAFAYSTEESEPLSIAFVDLDKFKLVNDTHGHQIGDQVLATTAKILQEAVRSSDLAARYGGEEFVLVFPNTNSTDVRTICKRLVRTLEETKHTIDEKASLTVTVSIGIATHTDLHDFKSVEDLVDAADQALYQAKMEGRNRTKVFAEEVA